MSFSRVKKLCPIYHVLLKGKRTMHNISCPSQGWKNHAQYTMSFSRVKEPCIIRHVLQVRQKGVVTKELGEGHNLWAFSSTQIPNRTEQLNGACTFLLQHQSNVPVLFLIPAQHNVVRSLLIQPTCPFLPLPLHTHLVCSWSFSWFWFSSTLSHLISFLKVSMNKSGGVPVNVSISYKDWWPLFI